MTRTKDEEVEEEEMASADGCTTQDAATDYVGETSSSSSSSSQDGCLGELACFGEASFFGNSASGPIVAVENYTARSESIFRRRVPSPSRLVIGHENMGVRTQLIGAAPATSSSSSSSPVADAVLYVPQYGTISSVNAVTSLGLLLFYAYLDAHCPSSRTLAAGVEEDSSASSAEMQELRTELAQYQRQFEQHMPQKQQQQQEEEEGEQVVAAHVNAGPRMDRRPIHPVFYDMKSPQVQERLHDLRAKMLRYSNAHADASHQRHRFGLSVLLENEYDQRSMGGILRNANAFLVDEVCYLGRRKCNRVGAVGSYHYTPPRYLGESFRTVKEKEEEEEGGDGVATKIARVLDADFAGGGAQRAHIVRLATWSMTMRQKTELICGGPARWWLLDCGHGRMYAEDFRALKEELQQQQQRPSATASSIRYPAPHQSSPESLQWYMSKISDPEAVLSLCAEEHVLREAAGDGVVLVVPQEGKLPDISLLMQCERILTVLPRGAQEEDGATTPGLSTQVASAIAMQRLSSVLHPSLRCL